MDYLIQTWAAVHEDGQWKVKLPEADFFNNKPFAGVAFTHLQQEQLARLIAVAPDLLKFARLIAGRGEAEPYAAIAEKLIAKIDG